MPSSCRPQSRPADGFECEQDTISRPKPALEHEEVLQSSTPTVVEFDIEHVAVTDDPRLWPRKRKLITLGVVASAAIAPTLAVNMYNPAFKQIQKDLHATSSDISLSLSLFIVVQGNAPLFWSGISEIKGRKGAYIVSMIIFGIGSIVAALAQKSSVLIAMRVLQAAGSSSVFTLGGGTLADVFDTHERGTIMGVYYAAPLMGPAVGPIIGGLITAAISWRATFWFLVIFAGMAIMSFFLLFKETFRKERSYAYQTALKRVGSENIPRNLKKPNQAIKKDAREIQAAGEAASDDIEAPTDNQQTTELSKIESDEVKLTLADVNILGAAWYIIRQRTNAVTLIASSLTFGFQYGIAYTAAITFAAEPYSYGPIAIGLILLCFGAGCVAGSVGGGRWSDHTLRHLRMRASEPNVEGKACASTPEIRLRSTLPAMPLLPSSVLAYAWMVHFNMNIAGPAIMLFVAGFSCAWIYSSTLAYIVDANTGRSSTAVAANSSWRGITGLIIAEISVPLQNALGDGALYSIWAGVLVFLELVTILVMYRGAQWRAHSAAKAAARKANKDAAIIA